MDALFHWQYKLVAQLGKDGFRRLMVERMGQGRAFHAVVETLLKELAQQGSISSAPEQVLGEVGADHLGMTSSCLPIVFF